MSTVSDECVLLTVSFSGGKVFVQFGLYLCSAFKGWFDIEGCVQIGNGAVILAQFKETLGDFFVDIRAFVVVDMES